MLRALTHQAIQCERLGSPMYAQLFHDLARDYADNGRTFAMLAGRSQRPVHDAVPLRLAGAIHRIVLEGKDDRLARHYPSVGGSPGEDFPADFIAYMRDHIEEIDVALTQHVQTNEIGRSVVPLVLTHWLTNFGISSCDYLELGASAGLNLNFDRYYACYGALRMGDSTSTVRFMGDWFADAPQVPKGKVQIRTRRGVDISPLDIRHSDQRTKLLSFIWPDQKKRFQRTTDALKIAQEFPVVIDQQSADDWLATQLPHHVNFPTVVFHSIVWQYLGREVQHRLRATLQQNGSLRTSDSPLIWARMEPAGENADVRVTIWDGRDTPQEYVLCEIGYHGQQMKWTGRQN
ncbi:MAG: hypothetical protein RIR69_1325 [Actinomycetota bacterium]